VECIGAISASRAPLIWRGLTLVASLAVLQASPPAPFTFPALVDEYLDAFALRHPSIAAGNGLHAHDDRLEDFRQPAIRDEIADLHRFKSRFDAIEIGTLSADQRVDRQIALGLIDAWLLELETLQNWRRNPMQYADAISNGVHNLMTMESAPADERARQIVAKLAGVPILLAAARTNINNPPRVFAERAVRMLRGTSSLLETDLFLAFSSLSSSSRMRDLRGAADAARASLNEYASFLQRDVIPRASGSFAIGADALRARFHAEELIDLPVDGLLAIGVRELKTTQQAFTDAARKVNAGLPVAQVWEHVLADHPRRGQLVAAAERAMNDLVAFITARGLVALPPNEKVIVAAAPEYDLGLASMHASPPLEGAPVKSYYYITDAREEWPADQQEAWLRKFNVATLSDITAHETYPGHFVHSVFMRQTPGKIRRIWIGLNPFPQPSSGQDGWAHYAEHLVIEQGFHADDPRYQLAQLSEALTRICRLIAGIRLHTGAWSIDDAARLFENEAHLPGPAARQEAERGTYDPTYGGYFLGKIALLKLRDDYRRHTGSAFNLREFHEMVLKNGIAPWWAQRQLMRPGDTGAVIE
jgi:uncharacterized protein (DUF885 family)